jgi:hypothetical protein
MNHLRLLMICGMIAAIFTSCKKEKEYGIDFHQGTGSCRLTEVNTYFDTTIAYVSRFSYDDSNRISRIYYQQPYDTVITIFNYKNHCIIADHRDQYGNSTNYDSLVVDDQGKLLYRGLKDHNGGYSYWIAYSYSAAGEMIRADYYLTPASQIYTMETFRWEHGDVIESYNGNGYGKQDYYLNRPNQLFASAINTDLMWIGRSTWQSLHLPKRKYTFDHAGKIIREDLHNSPGIAPAYRTFSYECF